MIFSSILFVFLFFPIVFGLYYLSKDSYRNGILLIASLIFYLYGGKLAFALMLFSILINYMFAFLIDKANGNRKKVLLSVDVIINLGILVYFKYANLGINILNHLFNVQIDAIDVVLPIGISFFTFQAMSYVIDVYRGEQVEKNIANVGLYISFFPQLVAGPIVRYGSMAEQIKRRTTSINKIDEGVRRFIVGFGKKVILANNLAIVAEEFFEGGADITSMPIVSAWIGSVAFSLQIYYDFSGYSDMAIGLGKIFGFTFEENFCYPYISKSITEFWRRWHISLSRWFRDYVYIPLGGSRAGIRRQIINLAAVWFLTGLWHGADFAFVVWGLMYLVFLVFEKFVLQPEKRHIIIRIIWCICTLFIVNCGWILFNTESTVHSIRYIASMFGCYTHKIADEKTLRIVQEYGVYLLAGVFFATPLGVLIIKKMKECLKSKRLVIWGLDIAYLIVFFWSVSFLILGAHNPFIYFNF